MTLRCRRSVMGKTTREGRQPAHDSLSSATTISCWSPGKQGEALPIGSAQRLVIGHGSLKLVGPHHRGPCLTCLQSFHWDSASVWLSKTLQRLRDLSTSLEMFCTASLIHHYPPVVSESEGRTNETQHHFAAGC